MPGWSFVDPCRRCPALPSCDGWMVRQVLFAFTLVRREGVRNEFWGQAFVEGTSVLDKRGKVRLNFGDLKVRRRAL